MRLLISYNEALKIWNRSPHTKLCDAAVTKKICGGVGYNNYNKYSNCRTYFPIIGSNGYTGISMDRMFVYNNCLETVVFVNGYDVGTASYPSMEYTFSGCIKLRKVIGNIARASGLEKAFENCNSLEYVEIIIQPRNASIGLHWSPKLSLESLNYMISHSPVGSDSNDNPLITTVTLHKDVYDRLTDELIALAATKTLYLQLSKNYN